MEEALRFLRAYELWIYLLLAFGGLIYIRKFFLSWQELRGAAFGLERESAQGRLNQAASVLVLLLSMTIAEFVLVSFIAPGVPGAVPLPSPTLDLLATPTTTLVAGDAALAATPLAGTVTAFPTGPTPETGCLPGQIAILAPANGSEIEGTVVISGTVNVENFGFYKLEMKRPEETNWLTILAGNDVVIEGALGSWNTSLLSPGEHDLSLVVTDNQGISSSPCTIRVRVRPAPEE